LTQVIPPKRVGQSDSPFYFRPLLVFRLARLAGHKTVSTDSRSMVNWRTSDCDDPIEIVLFWGRMSRGHGCRVDFATLLPNPRSHLLVLHPQL
jgi:hypothetical protein